MHENPAKKTTRRLASMSMFMKESKLPSSPSSIKNCVTCAGKLDQEVCIV